MRSLSIRTTAAFSFAIAVAIGGFWGCSASDDSTTTGFLPPETSSSSGSGGAGGMMAASSSSGLIIDAGTDGSKPLDDAGACESTSVAPGKIPLDMVILLDESGSMEGAKWDGITKSLKSFINDPASAGIGVGIVYFPVDSFDDCKYADYANLNVPIGALPGNAQALSDSIDAEMPQGGTPTYGALKGALFAATGYQDKNPTHKVVLVLATDGDPTSCTQTDIPSIAALAQSALNYNGVQTYVVGVAGSTIPNLDQIAAAGGTGKAIDVTANVNDFSQKMADIRVQAASCSFPIPPPPNQQMLDPTQVNVSLTPGMGKGKTLPQADSLGDCGNGQGWYYDNNAKPTKIILCPASCDKVQADNTTTIDVLFGCKTMIN